MVRGNGLLADGERIIFETHRHPLFLATRFGVWLLASVALALAGVWVTLNGPIYPAAALWLAALVAAAVGFAHFLQWRGERYIVTTHRVMQLHGVLSRRVFDSSLEKVNDILLTQTLLGRIFGYGNLEIITGSDIGLNDLRGIGRAVVFKRTIVEARSALEDGHAAGGRMVQLLEALEELRDSGLISSDEYDAKRRQLVSR